ncbi:MAG: hypothetical protein ACLP6E_18950, partial [Acidimicrobiales bacterium]
TAYLRERGGCGRRIRTRNRRTAARYGQLLDEWVELRANLWAPKTLDEAKREIENRIRPRLGRITRGEAHRQAPRRRLFGMVPKGPRGLVDPPAHGGDLLGYALATT